MWFHGSFSLSKQQLHSFVILQTPILFKIGRPISSVAAMSTIYIAILWSHILGSCDLINRNEKEICTAQKMCTVSSVCKCVILTFALNSTLHHWAIWCSDAFIHRKKSNKKFKGIYEKFIDCCVLNYFYYYKNYPFPHKNRRFDEMRNGEILPENV